MVFCTLGPAKTRTCFAVCLCCGNYFVATRKFRLCFQRHGESSYRCQLCAHDIDHDVACESRLIECQAWLAENGRERELWIALDDIPVLFGHKPGNNIYIVNRDHGLRDHDIEAISALIVRLRK